MNSPEDSWRIGVVGSGFIARGLVIALEGRSDMSVSRILTRSDISSRHDVPRRDLLTNSLEDVISTSDLVVECTGDPLHATEVVDEVLAASLPVVTLNAEFHVTSGSYFVHRGIVTESEGDQPGCLAALHEEAVQMGFRPLVYGNIKGFINLNPALEEMQFWAQKQGISLAMVTASTDGTKVQIEQALVANGLGADIAQTGLLGVASENIEAGAQILAEKAKEIHSPLSDYLRPRSAPPGVFLTAEHKQQLQAYFRYYKLGDGPYYTLLRNYHLCNLEVPKTIHRVLKGGGVLLNNSSRPRISVAAISKRTLRPGEPIRRGIGGFEVRGVAVRMREHPDHVPIGLLSDAVVIRFIEPGQMVTMEDIDLPSSLALEAWESIM